jgi:uncharacterized C2H2 Zn-finger protein
VNWDEKDTTCCTKKYTENYKDFYVKKILFLILITTVAYNMDASTIGLELFNCPICQKEFEYRVQYSYSTFGQNLDLRPYGAAIIPSPIPKCPNCGFVFSEEMFTEKEIKILKEAFEINNIFMNEPDMPNYYYLAREMEILRKNLDNIIWFFLSAVWENNDKNKKDILVNTTIEYIDKLEKTNKSYNDYQLVKLDLLRRSGKFDEAKNQIDIIKKDTNFYKDYTIKIIDLQTELISEKNIDEHAIPR